MTYAGCSGGHRHCTKDAFNLQWRIDKEDPKLLRHCVCNLNCRHSVRGTKRGLKRLLSRAILEKEVPLWKYTVVLWLSLKKSLPYFRYSTCLISCEIGILITLPIYSLSLIQILLYLPARLTS